MRKFCVYLFSFLLSLSLFSVVQAATTQEGWDIINQLRKEGRTDDEIKIVIERLGYNANEYISSTSQSTITTNESQNIINQLRQQGRTEEEINYIMRDLGIESNQYIMNSTSSNKDSYTSRSCKLYNIEYINNLGAYSSPDLKKREYFINTDYFKRYIDSKNPQMNGCPSNEGWIDVFYDDTSNSLERFIAPNGKIYFIIQQNGYYTSNELASSKKFNNITELKNYIKNNNSLIRMGTSNSNYINNVDRTISNMKNEIFNI